MEQKRLTSIEEFKTYQTTIQNVQSKYRLCISICNGTGCRAFGGSGLIPLFQKELEKRNINDVEILETGCRGLCEKGPIVVIYPQKIFYQQVGMEDIEEIVSRTIEKDEVIDRLLHTDPVTNEKIIHEYDVPFYKKQMRKVLSNSGKIDPTCIEHYIANQGYSALVKVLEEMSPEMVIDEIKASGLRGRGGAGFPTGDKWAVCRNAYGEMKYVICNADEGDPGAFMNRTILEGDPHIVIEGMTIAAYAVSATQGYIYVRAEYPLAIKHLNIAIQQAKELGIIGKNILGTEFCFDIEIKEGHGAFVCGEETALIASIEGNRGMPRQKPPFPAECGLWGMPTVVNNVETLANVPIIINQGAEKYSTIGTTYSKGTKIFALSGKVNNTGLVELPLGIPLRELIFDIGGGLIKGKRFKGAMIGGPSGGVLLPEELDTSLDYETLEKHGAMLGSGIVMVMDEDTCAVDTAKAILEFLKDESCGKCTPCRIGLYRMFEILDRITKGEAVSNDLNILVELGNVIKNSALCNLGKTAPNPILSLIDKFDEEFRIHIDKKKCPAYVCSNLYIAPCADTCPVNIEVHGYVALIAEERFQEALELIKERNPFPSICGRVCHHPCEIRCRRGDIDDALALKALKRFVADHEIEIEEAMVKPKIEKYRDEKIAMIGAGPASLACAYHLVRRGYRITIFEALKIPGGMLAVGIPNYRLPKEILQLEIDDIQSLGVEIKTNTEVGKDIMFEELCNEYNAVFIGAGARLTSKLNIPNEDVQGVIPALNFLRKVNLDEPVDVKGKRIIVIGGGNVAIDAARTSLRLGAKEVAIIYRRTKDEMPASIEEIEDAEYEGVKIRLLVTPVRIIAQNGKVVGIECIKMQLSEFFDASGRRRPVEIPGSEFVIDTDIVIPAIGQQVDTGFVGDNLKTTKWGTIIVDPETQATSMKGVFAGGDVVTGAATVIDAISAGNRAAIAIDKYLNNGKESEEVISGGRRPSLVEDKEPSKISRHRMPTLDKERRVAGFEEVELGFTREMAVREAQRCLRCHEKE